MPTFVFNKLIRDKLRQEYVKLQQQAIYKELTESELLEALRQKIIEEANEIPVNGSKEAITSELADIQQVIDDIALKSGITKQEIASVKQKKFEKKGGFKEGLFVEKIILSDDDEWNEYYRQDPEKYKEIV